MSLGKNRWHWFRWVLFHLPGKPIYFSKKATYDVEYFTWQVDQASGGNGAKELGHPALPLKRELRIGKSTQLQECILTTEESAKSTSQVAFLRILEIYCRFRSAK